MKFRLLKLFVVGISLTLSSLANAGLINFDELDKGQYSGNSDFIVTGTNAENDGWYTPLIGTPGTDSDNTRSRYLCNSTDESPYNCYNNREGNIINFAFNEGIDSIILSMYWGGPLETRGGSPSVTSYDINGVMLETFGKTTSTATYSFNTATDIYSIKTDLGFPNDNLEADWWYGITSIDYKVSEVPEPSTLAIFALGMIGLASSRFKRQP